MEQLLKKARDLREQGKPGEALDMFNQILIKAGAKGDVKTILQGLADRAIVYRHLYEKTGERVFVLFARNDAELMLRLQKEIREMSRLHTALFLLAQADWLIKDYKAAARHFKKSLQLFKGSNMEKADWHYHYAKALYMSGNKKTGKKEFLSALNTLENPSEKIDSFLHHVYLSGAYASYSSMLKHDDPAAAKEYYTKAKKLIDSDKRLVVRKKQLQELKKHLAI